MSGFGTSLTSRDVRLESATWAKAEIDQIAVANCDFMSAHLEARHPTERGWGEAPRPGGTLDRPLPIPLLFTCAGIISTRNSRLAVCNGNTSPDCGIARVAVLRVTQGVTIYPCPPDRPHLAPLAPDQKKPRRPGRHCKNSYLVGAKISLSERIAVSGCSLCRHHILISNAPQCRMCFIRGQLIQARLSSGDLLQRHPRMTTGEARRVWMRASVRTFIFRRA